MLVAPAEAQHLKMAIDDVMGVSTGAVLSECRRGRGTRHPLTGLFHQAVCGRLAGYEDVK